jgi:hypothetical protein
MHNDSIKSFEVVIPSCGIILVKPHPVPLADDLIPPLENRHRFTRWWIVDGIRRTGRFGAVRRVEKLYYMFRQPAFYQISKS